jgi:hypothetical protein
MRILNRITVTLNHRRDNNQQTGKKGASFVAPMIAAATNMAKSPFFASESE